ncbi:replicative DNA helicase [Candidatus Saccharibacteria bacterium]|nr:replicative DNA helicase [Candidatus Saccharibacteria bacterium]MBR6122831.1 replicative DNA helicase [Candidatus Saccharibacteria bacterium]
MEESRSNSSGGRIPPQDLNAEKSLLGAILLSDTNFPDLLEIVRYRDFYDERHGKIFHAMTSLYQHHSPIDLLTLTAELRKTKDLKSVGGAAYLTELTNFVPTATHSEAYAKIVANAAIRRRLISAGTAISESGYEESTDINELLGSAEKELYTVTDQITKTDYVALESLLADAFDRMEELHNNKGALRGLKTGFRDLDKKTAGLQKGDLVIIGARPAMGKTTFAQNLAYNTASINGRGVLFFSMEMANQEIVDRMISDISGVDNWKIRTGNVTEEDYGKIGDALEEMDSIPLYLDDTSNMTVLELRNKARRAVHDHDIGLIIIDYLQLLSGSEVYRRTGNRVQEVTEISRSLKQLARELEIPVVALAQLSRSVTGRDDPRPVLSDLRESGSIEQDADLVMFLHRPDYYNQGKEGYEETHITQLIIAKHRHGPVGTIELYFHPELLRFMSLDKEHSEE